MSPVLDQYFVWSWFQHRYRHCLHSFSIIGGQSGDYELTEGLWKLSLGRHDENLGKRKTGTSGREILKQRWKKLRKNFQRRNKQIKQKGRNPLILPQQLSLFLGFFPFCKDTRYRRQGSGREGRGLRFLASTRQERLASSAGRSQNERASEKKYLFLWEYTWWKRRCGFVQAYNRSVERIRRGFDRTCRRC